MENIRPAEVSELLKKQISEITDRWKKEVESAYDMDFDDAIKLFFSKTKYLDVINIYCPDLLKEVYGIAEGSGIDYNTILAFQLSEEIDVLSDQLKGHHCTSISINRNQYSSTFLAQKLEDST